MISRTTNIITFSMLMPVAILYVSLLILGIVNCNTCDNNTINNINEINSINSINEIGKCGSCGNSMLVIAFVLLICNLLDDPLYKSRAIANSLIPNELFKGDSLPLPPAATFGVDVF